MRILGRCIAGLLLPLVLTWADAADDRVSILPNGGFEALVPASGVAETGGEFRLWTLKGSPLVPDKWTLNGWFKGELEIVKDEADDVGTFLRISAPKEREAHVELPSFKAEQLKAHHALDFRIRYRGGPILLKTYESTVPGKSPTVVTVETSCIPVKAASGSGPWRTFECRYIMPDVSFRLALGVAAGYTADVDAAELIPVKFKVEEGGQWLNARDFGATGSAFETSAKVTADVPKITVDNIGDFKPGQTVAVSKCNPRYSSCTVRGPTAMYGKCDLRFDDALEVRGFDGSGGDWLVFIVELTGVKPRRFRWSDDLARSWKGKDVPVTGDWQALSGGLEVRFKKNDELVPGHVLNVSARTQLYTVIERIEGKTVWLRDTPTRSTEQAVMQHTDTAALQRAINLVVKLKRNLLFPDGHYRLHKSLSVRHANLTIAGRSGQNTLLDISNGTGAVFRITGGRNVTVRNFRMIGHTSLADKPGTMRNVNGSPFWCCALKGCSAMTFRSVEQMLVENVHASTMASEAFYCQAPSRVAGKPEPELYTRSLTFRHCSVTDCAANAFNNNDTSEGTTVEYCRIDGAGWHAYEGPARFIRLIGNYVRNAGPFTIGDMSHRYKHLNDLGCGQAMIRDNVFESGGRCGGISVNYGARQVTIANNLFINYNGTAISVSGRTTRNAFPAKNMIVTGNIIDLTYRGDKPHGRTGIKIDASHVIAADNQIYVRGERIVGTTGISITEGIQDVIVHDNLIRNCGYGLKANRRTSSVATVLDPGTFKETTLPLEWHISHRYQGWILAWLADNTISTIAEFDPEALHFRLEKPRKGMKPGDSFHIFPPQARWSIHDNTITDCMIPVKLDVYGSATSTFRNNVVTRGRATDATCAVRLAGQFNLIGNQFQGFDTDGCVALELLPDRLERTLPNLIRDNVFQDCSTPIVERAEGLWKACYRAGNLHSATTQGGPLQPLTTVRTVLSGQEGDTSRCVPSPAPPAAMRLDGDVSEWPWSTAARVGELRITPGGDEAGLIDRFCAATDQEALFFAFDIDHGSADKLVKSPTPYRGDGLEISFRNANPKKRTPVFMLWAKVEGGVIGTTHGGATDAQAKTLERQTTCISKPKQKGWTCELRIPFAAMGLTRADVTRLKFNVGSLHKNDGMWLIWTTTGGKIFEVDSAGDIVLD